MMPHKERAGLRIDLRRDILNRALMRKAGLVAERRLDRYLVQFVQREPPLVKVLADLQRLLRADVGDDIDWVELSDLSERRLLGAAPDHVAGVDKMPAHLAVEGRSDLGVAEIELSDRDLARGGLDVRFGGLLLIDPVIDLDLRGRVFLQESRVAADLKAGVIPQDFLCLELRLGYLKLRLVLVLLDGEEKVIFLDDLPILKMNLLEIARHARNKVDLVGRLGVSRHDHRLADRLHLRQDHGDGRRAWRGGGRPGLSRR
jgi:hypothetical protein